MSDPTYGALPVQIDPTAWGGRTNTPTASLTVDSIQMQGLTEWTCETMTPRTRWKPAQCRKRS
jgi:hypothetical protein